MLGIENLKKLIAVGFKIPKIIAEDTADGKISLAEILGALPLAYDIIGVGKSWKDIEAEFKDLDDTEKQELHDYFAEEFDIPNDKVEAFVEDALLWAFTTLSLVERFKGLKN